MLTLLLWASTVLAAEIGSILFTIGKVSVQRAGQTLPLQKGDQLQAGDLVMTGPKGRVQIRMIDKSRVALRPGTRYKVEALVPPAEEQNAGVTTSDQGEKALIDLLQGGFRTITGSVGKNKPENYQVRTPVATIGIRGTEYLVQLCIREDADPCINACFIPPDGHVDPGDKQWELYVGVLSGGVSLTNSAGSLTVAPGEYGCVPSPTQAPVLLARPPKLIEGFAGSRRNPNRNDNLSDDDAPPQQKPGRLDVDPEADNPVRQPRANNPTSPVPPSDEQNVPGENTTPDVPDPIIPVAEGNLVTPVTFSSGPLGPSAAYSAADEPPSEQVGVNNQGNLTQFVAPYPNEVNPATYAIGSASVQGAGFDPATELRWGRWSGGTANITLGADQVANQDLSTQSLHWVIGPEIEGDIALPQSGTASYSVVGNTDPTDNLGNVGVLGDANLTADFTNGVVNTDVTLSIDSAIWQASGSGAIDSNSTVFGGDYSNVQINGDPGGAGEFSGFFLNNDASGTGLSYSLVGGDGEASVSGAVAFEGGLDTPPSTTGQ